MRRLIIARSIPWVIGACAPLIAEASDLEARIVSFGTYERVEEVVRNDARSPSGVSRASTTRLKESTKTIPAVLGTTFGYCVDILGFPPEFVGGVKLEKVVVHPELRRRDGKISTGYRLDEYPKVLNGKAYHCTGYVLNNEFEVVPGTWSFTLKFQGRALATMDFEVR